MKGTVVVITNSAGGVFATAVSTEQGTPAGFTVEDNQRRLATERAWADTIVGACHPQIAAAINDQGWLTRHGVSERLQKFHGWKEHVSRFELDDVRREDQ